MEFYVALLRAVNVGGRKPISMDRLRGWLSALGYDDVGSYLQSGNLVFSSRPTPRERLEKQLETEAERRLHLRTSFLVRSENEWAEILAENPFPSLAESDPAHLVVVLLKESPEPARVRELTNQLSGPEEVRAGSRHLYVTYPEGIGRSPLTLARIESKLGRLGTARNWNTVRALNGMTHPSPDRSS